MRKEEHLIWIDLEMSGLEFRTDTILEIATIVTDKDLNEIAEGPNVVIHHPEEVLTRMDDWNQTHHSASGLTQRVRESSTSLLEAQQRTLDFLATYTEHRVSPLCGNSVHQDRLFLKAYMPKLEQYFHYRNIDVSSIKELVHRWYPKQFHAPPKQQHHRALDDIRESIEELRFYRSNVFRPS